MDPSDRDAPRPADGRALREVAGVALKLGCTAFGGPAAHIAMLREEVVTRRQWLSEQHFLDLLGATNLIPGPNSTEMVIHVGHVRAGWRGLLAAGVLFILPAALMVGALAAVYDRYGATPGGEWLLYGIKPVIIAVVCQALWGLLRTAVKSPLLAIVGVGVLALYLLGANEIALLFGGALAVLLLEGAARWRRGPLAAIAPLPALLTPTFATAASIAAAPVSLGLLFLTFVKIGAVLYGSGYVLLAFLRNDFVERLGWLTDQQLLDAVAVGQFTPGPVFTAATFVGYLVGGWGGAVAATVGIFLPSFLLAGLIGPIVPKLRQSSRLSSLLDGVNVAALGLMAAVTWQLARAAIVDSATAVLALLAAVLLIRYRVNSVWLVLGGGAIGIAYRLLVR